MTGYTKKSELLGDATQSPGASASDVQISKTFAISAADSKNLRIDVTVAGSNFTSAAFSVQDSWDGVTWTTRKSAVTTNSATTFSWEIDAGGADKSQYPLRPVMRVVYSSGAGADATITSLIRSSRP